MNTLYIISKGMGKVPEEEMLKLEQQDRIPRASLLEDSLSAQLLDERYLFETPPAWRRMLYRRLPVHFSQIIEALFIRHRYDVILSQSEKVGLPLALLMRVFRMDTPHVVIISRITSLDPGKARQKMWFIRKTKEKISRFLIWSSRQRDIAIEKLGVPSGKIILLKRGTDDQFWRPPGDEVEPDMICSVGMEARDYPTLVEALRPLDIPCHIAVGASRGEIFETVKELYRIEDLPPKVTVGRKRPEMLRELYRRCHFAVVPLLPTDSDNGLTAILEAMAMGIPVICSRVEGQVDVIREGVTGIFVPQGDPAALRDAIVNLWENPKRTRMMGLAAREYICRTHGINQFVEAIQHEVTQAVAEHKREKDFTCREVGAET